MDFWTRMKKAVDKGLSVSKDWLGKAGDAARDLGEKGVLRLEIRELEAKSKDLLLKLGSFVYEQLGREQKASVTAKNQEISGMLEELQKIEDQVHVREQKIEMLKKQEEEADPSKSDDATSTDTDPENEHKE